MLDAFSRRVIGWALDRSLEDTLTLRALRMALDQRRPAPGLVHHSDRGVQYASDDYTDLLRAQGIVISMSRKANPYDNAKAESFMKTLKYEEVFREDYGDLSEAHTGIGRFLEQVYNQKRLHSALGYRPPAEFELRCGPTRPQRRDRSQRLRQFGSLYEFFQAGGNLSPMDSRNVPGGLRTTVPGLIGTMSFQLAIPRQVALPQSLPPLHQPRRILQDSLHAVQSICSERQTVS